MPWWWDEPDLAGQWCWCSCFPSQICNSRPSFRFPCYQVAWRSGQSYPSFGDAWRGSAIAWSDWQDGSDQRACCNFRSDSTTNPLFWQAFGIRLGCVQPWTGFDASCRCQDSHWVAEQEHDSSWMDSRFGWETCRQWWHDPQFNLRCESHCTSGTGEGTHWLELRRDWMWRWTPLCWMFSGSNLGFSPDVWSQVPYNFGEGSGLLAGHGVMWTCWINHRSQFKFSSTLWTPWRDHSGDWRGEGPRNHGFLLCRWWSCSA